MTCESARDLLFDEMEGLLTAEQRAELRVHLAGCAECQTEEAALRQSYAALERGLRAMVAPVTPSPAFWQGLKAGLDAVDTERRATRVRVGWRHRWVAAGAVLAALLAGLVAAGGPQQALADLRRAFYWLPFVGVGQVEPSALVAAPAAPSARNGMTLHITGLVSGRRVTLLSYTLSGRALLTTSTAAPVADALVVTLRDDAGHRYLPTYWVPARRGLDHGLPALQGLLAFRALPSGARHASLVAARLPLAPMPTQAWAVGLTLHPAVQGGAQTALPVDRSDTHHGIRLSVTDVALMSGSTLVDMESALTAGPYKGATVISLSPGRAVGGYAPTLTAGHGHTYAASAPPLTVPLQLAALARPEFVYPVTAARGQRLTVTVPSVLVRRSATTTLTLRAGSRRRVSLGGGALTITARRVAAPSGLGLGAEGARRLRVSVGFPPAGPNGTLNSVNLVAGGVSYTVGRDAPSLDLPLAPGQSAVPVSVEDPTVQVQGPWVIVVKV